VAPQPCDTLQSLKLHRSRLVRSLYFAVGLLALLAGLLGVLLPVLPTTPFVLLAAACFAKSSDRFYNALLGHRIAGPIIADWREHGAMQRSTKRWAIGLMVLSFGTSIWVLNSSWHRIMLVGMALLLGFFIWRVPVRADGLAEKENGANSV
jgi:uncharacterized membrane protein YbaN (DUF454 family)